jgi:hypothetical protein
MTVRCLHFFSAMELHWLQCKQICMGEIMITPDFANNPQQYEKGFFSGWQITNLWVSILT